LTKIYNEVKAEQQYEDGTTVEGLPETAEEYAAARQTYLKAEGEKNKF